VVKGGCYIICISRSVKRRPELINAPNRREIYVANADADAPLGRIAKAILRAQGARWDWCCQLSREGKHQKDGSDVLTKWVRASVGGRIHLPEGRKLSSYSLRIMGASAASATGRDINWIRLWGLWKTPSQVYQYIQDDYGYSEYAMSLFTFGKPGKGAIDGESGRAGSVRTTDLGPAGRQLQPPRGAGIRGKPGRQLVRGGAARTAGRR
jgi:hypothetical protein